MIEAIADRIAVMYKGKIVEEAGTDYMIKYPKHKYTKNLLGSVLSADPTQKRPTKRRIDTVSTPTVR